MKPANLRRATALLAATLALVGCGLKGSLTLPSQSEEIVIRPATTDGAAPPAEQKVTAPDERIPPPPLPGGSPGTARGG